MLAEIGQLLLEKSSELATTHGPVQKFLNDNPLPSDMTDLLPIDFRVFCLLLNALKQWVAAEQQAADRFFLAGDVGRELRY